MFWGLSKNGRSVATPAGPGNDMLSSEMNPEGGFPFLTDTVMCKYSIVQSQMFIHDTMYTYDNTQTCNPVH